MYNDFKKDIINYCKGKKLEVAFLNIDLLLEIYNKKLISFFNVKDKFIINISDGTIIAYKEGETIETITYIKGGF